MANYKNSTPSLELTCTEEEIRETQNYLCSYRLCVEMLHLRRYERKRAKKLCPDDIDCEDILTGSETFWKMRMRDIYVLINSMKNGREKLILYYYYIRGESIERAANLIGFSRRTGYRMLHRGILMVAIRRRKRKSFESKIKDFFEDGE